MKAENGKPADTNGKAHEERDMLVALIAESPANVRRHFDQAELEDLAASLKRDGVLVRLIVWQPDKRARRYELIDGAKRLRAAKLAGLNTVPVQIRDTDAAGARELILVCTVQRSDPSTLELADGLAELIREHGHTAETLAERIGKGVHSVRELVKVSTQLRPLAREALDAGRIAVRTALELARVPGDEARDEATRFVLAGWSHAGVEAPRQADIRRAEKEGREPLGFVQTKELIRERFMRQLKQAPFSTQDATLWAPAGSCEACPKRTGNNREDFPDSRGDICTDPACFAAKVRAHQEQLLERHKAAGRKVLNKKESEQLFGQYNRTQLDYHGRDKYVDLKEQCWDLPDQPSWKKLVGEQCAEEIVVALDGNGEPHELVPKASAMRVLEKDHGFKARRYSTSNSDGKYQRLEAERRRKAKAAKAAGRAACGMVAELAQRMTRKVIGVPPHALEPVRALVALLAQQTWYEACRQVRIRRQTDTPAEVPVDGDVAAIMDLAAKATSVPELFGLAAELIAARASSGWVDEGGPPDPEDRADAFWQAWGIDRKQLVKDATPANGKKSAKRRKQHTN